MKVWGIAVAVFALCGVALPASAAAASFENFEGTLTTATLNSSQTRITFAGSVTPTECTSGFRAEPCNFEYRVIARPAIRFYGCKPGSLEPDYEDDSELRVLWSTSVTTSAGAAQPFAMTTPISGFQYRRNAGFRICLQVLRSYTRPNEECAEFFDPSLCARETVYSYKNLATLDPTVESASSPGSDRVPRAKNCRPIFPDQAPILVYGMNCSKARKVVRQIYAKAERTKPRTWRLRAMGFSCHKNLTYSRPLICTRGKQRLESRLP